MNSKLKKITIISAIGITSMMNANAQSNGYPPYTAIYTPGEIRASKCDERVLAQQWKKAELAYTSKQKARENLQVKDQASLAPTAATNSMSKCLDGAFGAIKSISNGVDGLLGIFNGGFNPGAIASSVGKQLGDLACNQVDNYITRGIYNSTSGAMSTVGAVTGTVNNGVNVNTGIGSVNVGRGAVTPSTQKPAGSTLNELLK